MNKRIYIIAATILTAAISVSCTDDLEVNNGNSGQERQAITFTVDDSQDWEQQSLNDELTRAKADGYFMPHQLPLTTDGGKDTEFVLTTTAVNGINTLHTDNINVTRGTALNEIPTTFGVNAYKYTNSTFPTWISYFSNGIAEKDGTNWKLQKTEYWPENTSDMIRFYGYSPMNSDKGVTFSSTSYTGAPYIDFTVNETIKDQVDLMTAASLPLLYTSGLRADLHFRHALTCIKFAIGRNIPINGTIKSIILYKIVKSGRYEMGGSWTPSNDSTTFAMNNINFAAGVAENTIITYDEGAEYSTLLMIPQSFDGYDQKIEMKYNNGIDAEDIIVTASLKGTEWLPGTTVTYNLSVEKGYEYVLEATSAAVGHDGGEATFNVTSYRNGTTQEAVPWHIVGYSTDGTTFTEQKPEDCTWVGFATTNGNGSVNATKGYAIVCPQVVNTDTPTGTTSDVTNHKAYLSATPERGDSYHYYDLSKHDLYGHETAMNTANCYVVNAPGYYKLPLVYGNAIVNGGTNATAYTGTYNQDYLGQAITNPYIYKNYSYTPQSAILVWQDAEGLISTDVSHPVQLCDMVDGKYTYLSFYIDKSNIQQGNAIVAVCDNSSPRKIMWSWHIWVTAQNIYKTIPIVNYYRKTFNIMPCNLGWCSTGNDMTYYKGRKLYVKIQQDGGKTAIFSITQMAGADFTSETGYCPFYQGGRKDPSAPGIGGGVNGERTTYGTYPAEHPTITTGKSVSESIQNPHRFYSKAGSWSNITTTTTAAKLWCAGNSTTGDNDIKIVKTIYDPCPVGFHVPETRTFTAFTTTAARVENSGTSLTNINAQKWSNGYYFYTNGAKNQTVHFPATGSRDVDSNKDGSVIIPTGTAPYTAIPADATSWLRCWCAADGRRMVQPLHSDGSARGTIIRPVKDY